jgi:hypothetical protein
MAIDKPQEGNGIMATYMDASVGYRKSSPGYVELELRERTVFAHVRSSHL